MSTGQAGRHLSCAVSFRLHSQKKSGLSELFIKVGQQARRQARRSSGYIRSNITRLDHVSESFGSTFGMDAVGKSCLAFSCCLGRHINGC